MAADVKAAEIKAAETKKESVYIVIPVFNRKETTLACLARLQETGASKRYYVVVVDDASTDGTEEAIAAQHPETIVVAGDGDLWWTGGMAMGMEYAAKQGAEYFIWLNDDCVPVGDALFQLVDYMRAHPRTIAAPTCYAEMGDGSLVKQHNAFAGRKGFAASEGEVLSAEGLSGWCVGIPGEVFREIGLPDAKKFPHYSGDDTYIYRATKAGFRACVLGDITAHLFGGVHPRLDFRNHFGEHSTPAKTFHSLFLSKRSPYLLSTRFFYFTERYGLLFGALLFLIKLVTWIAKWLRLQVAYQINPQKFQSA